MAKAREREGGIKGQLGARVRQLRERAGLTQGDLANASGLSKVYLGTVERAEKGASVEVLEKLAHGLGVTPAELLRFGARAETAAGPAEQLGKKVAALAKGASPGKLARFEVIARAYFEDEDAPLPRQKRRPRAR